MRIVIAGAHGQVARRLGRLLSARGDTVVGIVRNPAHEPDLDADGVRPVVLDLEAAGVAEVAGVLAAAEQDLLARTSPAVTVLRPGGLTDEPGTGLVHLAPTVGRGSIPRDDVAAVLLALLDRPRPGAVLELVGGDTPVEDAVRATG